MTSRGQLKTYAKLSPHHAEDCPVEVHDVDQKAEGPEGEPGLHRLSGHAKGKEAERGCQQKVDDGDREDDAEIVFIVIAWGTFDLSFGSDAARGRHQRASPGGLRSVKCSRTSLIASRQLGQAQEDDGQDTDRGDRPDHERQQLGIHGD